MKKIIVTQKVLRIVEGSEKWEAALTDEQALELVEKLMSHACDGHGVEVQFEAEDRGAEEMPEGGQP